MAEIRKHDPAAGNAIAQALRAAMGEPVQPFPPGSAPLAAPAKNPASRTSWVTVQVAKPTEQSDDPDED
ncbi:MAG: hypothetical protein ACOH1Y_09550 [Propionicimonas sp.]